MIRFLLLLSLLGGLVCSAAAQAGTGSGTLLAQAPTVPTVPPSGQVLDRGRESLDKGKEAATAGAERALEKVPSAADLKAVRDELAGRVDKLQAAMTRKFEEAGDKAMSYAIWGGVALFGIMVLASVVGGAIVALIFRRR